MRLGIRRSLPPNGIRIERLSDIIVAVYESALSPEGWFKALHRIAEFSGSDGCRIVLQSDSGGAVIYSVVRGIESRILKHRIEPHASGAPASTRQPVVIGEPIIQSRTNAKPPIAGYSEPWQEQAKEQVSDVLTLPLLNSPGDSVAVQVMRTDRQDPYGEHELDCMALIGRHIGRVFRISDRLNVSRLAAEMFEASLDHLSAGVFLVDRHGRVAYLNPVARAQVKSGKALRLLDARLVATDRAAQRLLQAELIQLARDPGSEDRPGRAVALADGEGTGFSAYVLPLRGGLPGRVQHHFAAMAAIFVQDPATVSSSANAAFAQLYGLTDGELRLLNGLMPGLTLAEAAQLIGIREATAKTHLRRIFAKTRTSRQAELFYLLLTSTPPTCASCHDPEKCKPVSGRDHARTRR